MEFSAREDIEAPIDYVFEQVTDFALFERSIMRRGGDVERTKGNDTPEVGTQWRVSFRMRGKDRTVQAELTRLDRPNTVTIEMKSDSVDGQMNVELVALSRDRTRMIVTSGVSAKTISAKVFVQSIKLARGKTTAKFESFVAGFAKDVQAKYRD